MERQDRQAGPAGALNIDSHSIDTDALVVGAGPVGLFQVFQLGLQGIQAHVVDVLPVAGGQCIELYPDKPIYDIPAVPVCSGGELVQRLLTQIEPFTARFHFGHMLTTVQRQADGRFLVETNKGRRFRAKTLFIAGGAGSFQPRSLKLDGLAAFEGSQLFHSVEDPAKFAGQHLVVAGGGELALDWALNFAQRAEARPASVTLIHRRDQFQAPPAQVAQMKALCATGAMKFMAGQVVGIESDHGRLVNLVVAGADEQTHRVALDMLLVGLGLSPKLGPVATWGLAMERKQLVVDTAKFQTTVPGIFAVGDINTYPGKRKLIVSGFHEATLAAFAAAAFVWPDKPVLLQYTTTSPRLHQLLGVQPAAPEQPELPSA